jgi:hypothetical protein
MKNSRKLEAVNQKIAKLSKLQKELEARTIDSLAKKIIALLLKKRALRINTPALLKNIEKFIDEKKEGVS